MTGLLLCLLAACAAGGPGGPALPGPGPAALPRSPDLRRRLKRAWATRDPDLPVRTHHRFPDGTPRFVNRLLLEPSPYLRQHAFNPVDWFPWGEEAFALARRLGRPVLLSVGYSTCHWCHVMEEESFEDVEIARLINERYVPVKVDREERPDVDAAYMEAVHAFTGSGGWPMTVWLTPDGEPFYAGTYFPARDGDRGAAVGLETLLTRMAELWARDPEGVRAEAERFAEEVRRRLEASMPGGVPGEAVLREAARRALAAEDRSYGGAHGRHKFPSGLPLRFLLAEAARTGDEGVRAAAIRQLRAMAAGGIHDALGGGFHRYAVEPTWTVPHYEKMLYDNARLAATYAEAWTATGEARFREVALDTLAWMDRELSLPGGGFAAALDADSPGPDGRPEEGAFYLWSEADVRAILPGPEAAAAIAWFGIGPSPGPLVQRRTVDEVARELGRPADDVRAALERARAAMREARDRRPRPARDDKVVTAWNGLAISATARAGALLGRDDLVERGARAARFALGRLRTEDGLLRTWRDGVAGPPAVLEDYGLLALGLLDLVEATGEPRWLVAARELVAEADERFGLPDGGWARTAAEHDAPLGRERPVHDGAVPSGVSAMALAHLRLWAITGEEDHRRRARAGLAAVGGVFERAPTALGEGLLAVEWLVDPPPEVVIVGEDEEARALLDAARRASLRPLVVLPVRDERRAAALARVAPPVEGKVALDGRATAYVCRMGACAPPVREPDALARTIAEWRRPAGGAR